MKRINTDRNNLCCKCHKKMIISSLIMLDVSVISIIPYNRLSLRSLFSAGGPFFRNIRPRHAFSLIRR